MPFDGNGNWTSTFSAQADKAAGYKILASRFDNIFIADLATSFENCLTKDAQVKPQQAFDANSYKVINVGDPTNNQDAVNKRTMDSAFSEISTDLFKPGMVVPFAGSTAPSGWLICDGAAISRSTYSALFAVIGTTYGAGDGSTTFNIPDLQDRILQGAGTRGTVGNYVPESLPNIKGGITSDQSNRAYRGNTGTGALYTEEGSAFTGTANADFRSCGIFLDASLSSSTYQDNAPVQQDAVCVNCVIKY